MISFYPGPSRVYDQIPGYVKDAHKQGILSMNHRSEEFMALCEKTVTLLKEKLDIPKTYTVFFTSSATECWEIIAQSIISEKSLHLFNGAFGEKWFDYTQRLVPGAQAFPFDRENKLDLKKVPLKNQEVICVTQNETSIGTEVSNSIIASIKRKNPRALVAVDATSSMAGIELNFKSADVWFASVQKCFGLPAGLAVMVCSPQAMQYIKSGNEKNHYNSLLFMQEMMAKWQTPCTPNVLGIYLLMRVLEKRKPINLINEKTKSRFIAWQKFFRGTKNIKLFIKNQGVRSLTVLTLTGKPEQILEIKKQAKAAGFLLGEGYGPLKNETFRIANFPALKKNEIRKLQAFLSEYL
ncbi:MAG: aminotransferase class V-fold PLP-dependent enzyme [Cyclobacteriaceae bacterium]